MLGLGSLIATHNPVPVDIPGAALMRTSPPYPSFLLILAIIIVILIYIHLPSGRLLRRWLFSASGLLLDRCLNRWGSSRRPIRCGGGPFSHWREVGTGRMRRHMLDGWKGRRVMSCLGRVIVFIYTMELLTSGFRRVAASLSRRRHAVWRGHMAITLVVNASAALIVCNLFGRTGVSFPLSGTLHG